MQEREKYSTVRQGVLDGFPISLGYLPLAFTFGMMTTDNHLPIWAALFVSATNFTSASQFAGIDLILTGQAYIEIAITTLIINIRYFLMSLSLSQKIDDRVNNFKRGIIAFSVTDEIFALAMQRPGWVSPRYLVGLTVMPYLSWALGSLVGAAATGFLPMALRDAFGIALFAMFLLLIIKPSKESKPVLFTVSIAVALSCLIRAIPMFDGVSSGWVIIICALVASSAAAVRYPVTIGGEEV